MRKKIIILFIGLTSLITVYCQQETQFTQYNYSILPFNPGYAGMNGSICFGTVFRQQWTGFKEVNPRTGKTAQTSPQTLLFTFDMPIKLLHGGVGLSIMNDKAGYENNIALKLGYSYHLNIGMGTLGIGVQGGFTNKKIDFDSYYAIEDGDPRITNRGNESDMIFDMSFGLWYKVPELFYVGIASTQMLEQEGNESSTGVTLKRHYFINGGYEWVLPSNPSFSFEPSVFIKTDFVSAQYDITFLAKYNQQFWAGLSYRVQDAVAIIIGAQPTQTGILSGLRLGYSYDITTSSLGRSGRSYGSHEVVLRYCFKVERQPVFHSYKNTRMLGNF